MIRYETLLLGDDSLLDQHGRLLDGAEDIIRIARKYASRLGLVALETENITTLGLADKALQRQFDYVTPPRLVVGERLGVYHRHAVEQLSAFRSDVVAVHGSWTGLLEARRAGCTPWAVMSQIKGDSLHITEKDTDLWLHDLPELDVHIKRSFR